MKMACEFEKHVAAPAQLTVSGLPFSSCRRCGLPMIQWRREWLVVPRGERFAWQATATAQPQRWGEKGLCLPAISSIEVKSRTHPVRPEDQNV